MMIVNSLNWGTDDLDLPPCHASVSKAALFMDSVVDVNKSVQESDDNRV
jgi:hypothetical protein